MADCFRGRLRRKIFRLEPTRTAANVGVCLLNFGLTLLVNTRVYDGNSANNSDVPESITKSEIGGRRNRMKGMATEREKRRRVKGRIESYGERTATNLAVLSVARDTSRDVYGFADHV
ncbi:hypothetical protein V1477_016368 [Vespula maculifrons]|uniref:Uncharacterized protein n=1 Tax=Vespula maculifrons TaxID=7453 RepID=A0ABD2BCU0_VESMC